MAFSWNPNERSFLLMAVIGIGIDSVVKYRVYNLSRCTKKLRLEILSKLYLSEYVT